MTPARSSRADQATDISAAITSIHRVSYARELSSVDTVVGDGCVASVLRFEVAPAPLRAAVERTTGRTVIAFQSSMNPRHGLIVEAFVLA